MAKTAIVVPPITEIILSAWPTLILLDPVAGGIELACPSTELDKIFVSIGVIKIDKIASSGTLVLTTIRLPENSGRQIHGPVIMDMTQAWLLKNFT
jgi:hypothetical protein